MQFYHSREDIIIVTSERSERGTIYDIVTRVIQLISPSQSCDNLFITYLCLYQVLNRENTGTRSECVFH